MSKRTIIILTLALVFGSPSAHGYEVTLKTDHDQMTSFERRELKKWHKVRGQKFKKRHADGHYNCVFSKQPIPSKDSAIKADDRFASSDKVYARCYFRGKVTVPRSKFYLTISVDGTQVNFFPEVEPPKNQRRYDFEVTKAFDGELPTSGQHEVQVDIYTKGKVVHKETVTRHSSAGAFNETRSIHRRRQLSKAIFSWDAGAAAPRASKADMIKAKTKSASGCPEGYHRQRGVCTKSPKCQEGYVLWMGKCRPGK